MFHRRKQVRTKSASFLPYTVQIFALEQQREKALGKIFGVLSAGAVPPHVAIDRPPIRAAKFFESLLCCRRFTLCLEHHTPVRSSKNRRALARRVGPAQ